MNINFFNDNLEENIVKIEYKDIKLFLVKNLFDEDSFKQLQLEMLKLMNNSENWELAIKEEGRRKELKYNVSPIINDINNNLKKSKLLSYINKIAYNFFKLSMRQFFLSALLFAIATFLCEAIRSF